MTRVSLLVSSFMACASCALAQAVDSLAPSSITPKPLEKRSVPAIVTHEPRSPRPNPEGDKPLLAEKPDLKITAIVIFKSRTEIQEAGLKSEPGLFIRDVPFLDRPDFRAGIQQKFLGKLLTENNIRDLEDWIILYCRKHDKLMVDAILPPQNIDNGVLQLWFLEGKVGNLGVKNAEPKWFPDKLFLDEVHLKPGESIDSKQLREDLTWLNNNPFRQVDAVFKPGEKLGLTDVDLQVQDRFPVRPYVGYEDSGTRFTGEDRFLAGLNWGNAFGLDHQFNYQFASDLDFDLVKAHSASYIAPLPWRHNLVVYGSYADVRADFSSLGLQGTTANGVSWQVSGRYSIPLPEVKRYRHELSAGFDFKRSNNNLLAGGLTVLQNSDTDIDQFVVAYTGLMPDRFGRTSFGLEGFFSPGGLTTFNHDEDFDRLRVGSSADYVYGRLNLERVTRLPFDFSWVLTGWGQVASDRLLPSEELGLGGYNTVRGYDERVVLGDNGWIVSNELRAPPWSLANLLNVPGARDELQLLAFFDYGAIRLINPHPEDGSHPDKDFYSWGAGLRYSVNRHFSLRFDWGFPLTEKSLNKHGSRAHLGVMLSF